MENSIREQYLGDQGGYLFIATLDNPEVSTDEALELLRKRYLNSENHSLTQTDIESGYNLHLSEMENYQVSEMLNQNEYAEALRIWGVELQQWTKLLYKTGDYLFHVSFRDVLHEGIFESITKFKYGYLYWYHG